MGSTARPSAEGAAAGTITLDAPEGPLSGLATVCRYLASLSPNAADLTGSTTPEHEAAVAEWLARATSVELSSSGGVVGDDKLDTLNAHLHTRSTLVGLPTISIADLAMYGAVHSAVAALSDEKRKGAFINLVRWCDFIGGAAGGNAVFGAVKVIHGEFPVLAVLHPPVVPGERTAAKALAATAAKGGGKGKPTDLPASASDAGSKKAGGAGGNGGEAAAGAESKAPTGGAAAADAAADALAGVRIAAAVAAATPDAFSKCSDDAAGGEAKQGKKEKAGERTSPHQSPSFLPAAQLEHPPRLHGSKMGVP